MQVQQSPPAGGDAEAQACSETLGRGEAAVRAPRRRAARARRARRRARARLLRQRGHCALLVVIIIIILYCTRKKY